jgi:uncharacterized protein (TIGR03435 family)
MCSMPRSRVVTVRSDASGHQMTIGRYLLLAAVVASSPLFAQSYSFEAASVKPASPDNPPGQGVSRAPGGRFTAVNAPLRFLIVYAYQLQGHQLVGAPDWIANERFDIVAKMEGDPPPIVTAGPDPMRLATRALLADRFGLVVHRETRELDIYALTMAKPGGQPGRALKPSPEDCAVMAAAARAAPAAPGPDGAPPFICGQSYGQGRIRFAGYPLSLFANGLSLNVGRAVLDRTGLTGNWAFELTYAPEPSPDSDAPGLFTAIQEQLGLKLESTKGPVEVLVIDSVARPTPD